MTSTFIHVKFIFTFVLLLCFHLGKSQKIITGTVIDANSNEPLIAANISVPGSTQGSITDFDGNFTIEINDQVKVLEISYIGYTTQNLNLTNQTNYIIKLLQGKVLDEVLVIGYSVIKKSDKTGAVTSVSSDELNTGRLSDPIEALQGKAAGVTVSKQGGDPNSGFSVNIRGAASFTSGTGPLFVVDGVPGVDPTTIAPTDIASYNVLKDAASTAIYGARGANGVIIITTKSGKRGDGENLVIEYSSQLSIDNVSKKYDLLSGDQIRDFANKTGRVFLDGGANVDWQDEIYRTGLTQDHNLSFMNATKSSNFRASLSHMNIQGVIKGSSKTRSIGRLNYSQNAFNDFMTFHARLATTLEKNNYINYGGGISPTNVIYQALRRSPTDKVRNDDGSFYETDRSFQYFNPLAIIEDIQNNRDAKRILGNVSLDLNFFKNLKGWINGAYIRDDDESLYFEPRFTASNQTNGRGVRSYNNKIAKIWESTLTYTKNIKEAHNFSVMAGHSYQIEQYDGFRVTGRNATSDYIGANNMAIFLDHETERPFGYKNENILAALFSRATYDYKSKYLFSASIRREGSSKFGLNNRWGWFPSASFGWNLLEESFFGNQKIFDQLKLRLSYGLAGNQNIPSDREKILFGPSGRAINPENGEEVINYTIAGGTNPNPNLKWETNAETNIGIDFGIMNGKLSGSIELYQRRTYDLVYDFQVPVPPNRQPRTTGNAGEIKNTGIEATLQYFVLNKKSLKWKTLVALNTNRQKTVSLGNEEFQLGEIQTLFVSGRGLVGGINNAQVIRPGLAVGTFVMPEYAGLSDDGKFLFYTAAGGVTRDVSKAERRVVGSAQPKFQIGWSNYFTIGKNLDISASFRSIIGYKVLNVTRMVFSNPSDLPTLNVLQEGLEEYDRGLTSNPTLSSYYLEDASFLRLDNVTIGYNLNIKHKYIKSVRFYMTGTNLLLITGYSGIDPEISFGGSEFGRDQYDVYPRTRTITLGFNSKF
ncbi:MAG: SusC/RagA family TonB-linked outer membrane protein [Saprospiraceae bacterium]|nr:SusC/RagA family TonB-linked outer membrane protein [Saprospiraceae bacterium]